jgi:uncharacterized membrane protein YdjX (TVP38/TMEM64 family)
MSASRRALILVVGVATLALLAWLLPVRSVQASVAALGPAAPLAAIAVGAALLVALVPRTPISLACGLLFGVGLGTLCAIVLALIAAAVTFAAGRLLGREFVARRAGRYWHRIERFITVGGVFAVAATRSFPLGPYGLTGYAYGASAIRFRSYALGTAFAATPSAITYAMVGAAVVHPHGLHPLTLVPLLFGLVVSTVAVLLARARLRASAIRATDQ